MRKQFIILVVTAVLLVLGWTIVEYLMQSQLQYQYKQLSGYPVIIYSWEDSLLTTLQTKLMTFDYVKVVEYKTSEQATAELIQKYRLQGAEDILQEKTLPNVLIIYLKGSASARSDRFKLQDFLGKVTQQNRMMIEYQNNVWDNTMERIDQLIQIRWIMLGFLSLVISLVFFFKRIHYEHRMAHLRSLIKGKQMFVHPLADHFWLNSALLVLLPVFLSFVLYEIFYNSDLLLYSLDWYFFLIQLTVLTAATLIAYPFEVKYKLEQTPDKDEL